MLYGTFAATHFLARSMISARVVLRRTAPSDGGPEAPEPFSGPFSPCGVPGTGSESLSARGAPALWPAAAAAPAAPQDRTTPAAVARTRARRAPCAAGWPPYRTGTARAAVRRCRAHPAQVQSMAGSYSSKTGTVMRFPSALVTRQDLWAQLRRASVSQLSRHKAF
ncbi:hypothetical protein SMICM304S_07609 [Streptomyces microflavus]